VRRERYDALLDDRLLFEYSGSSVGLVNAGCLNERHSGYLALSPKDRRRSSAIAEAFERGIKNIREGGQLCEIVEEYGLGTEFVPELNGDYCLSDGQ
jgi:polar amino acid transport system substrate-binding protein